MPVKVAGVGVKWFQVSLIIRFEAFLSYGSGTPAAKTADLILIMLDATKSEEQRRLLEFELDTVGIRLNKNKRDVVFKKRTTGGVRSDHV